ncbi:MAG: CRISPR-associated helicase Cas3' [Peptoanaerobacter stomatis]|uniref:CRISPR-associated helicase Cas3' n=1 Tax=Peptoanaerobacter stomatis TaxID=796937 RepID=UPI003FA0E40B
MIDDKLYDKLKHCYAKEDESIEVHVNNVLEQMGILKKLGYIDDEKAEILGDAIKCHDVGKANKYFQNRILSAKEGKKKYFDKENEVGHNILSPFLCRFGDDERDYITAYAIVNHHYYVKNNFNEIKEKEDILNKNIEEIYKSYNLEFDKNNILDLYKFISILQTELEENPQILKKALLILGLLNKCDYAASAHMEVEYSADFLQNALENMMDEWKNKNSSASWNDIQKFCMSNKDTNLIVVAPTGTGKTEAALSWIGDNKGFFILPLKTAINSIYDRVKKDIVKDNISKRVALLHGDTFNIYNDEEINANNKNEEDIWAYYEKSKLLSIPLNISTPDQIFDFIFKAIGFEPKYAMLSYSKVVIDEIQAYDSNLLACIIIGIQNIIDIGGKVSIFTATLPPFVEDLLSLKKAGSSKIERYKFVKNIADIKGYKKRHNIKILEEEMNADLIYEHYKNSYSKKYLVVCNTVKKSQEIYQELKDKGIDNINLLHSKFVKLECKEKENHIMFVGKTYKEDNETINEIDEVWVCTQIVEASLDIDFDYIFTELSDLNGLFQRLGRINRKGAKNINEHNCFIFTEINRKLLIEKEESTRGFIDEAIYKLSKKAILSHGDGILTEEDKLNLIDEYLTTENMKESVFLKRYWISYDYYSKLYMHQLSAKNAEKYLRNIISFDVFPKDINNGLLNEEEINLIFQRIKAVKEHLNDKNKSREEKKKYVFELSELKSEIMKYTVSVGLYDLGGEKVKYLENIEISKNTSIPILLCHYDELGFRRLTEEESKNENFDNKDDENFI